MTTERLTTTETLAGRHVAITGRLASMARDAAAGLVVRHGGSFHPNVSRETTLLVVGREGWPLRANGQLTRKLLRARQLQQQGLALEVLPEEHFLRLLELPTLASEVCQSYTMCELTRLLGVPRRRIEAWQRSGLLTPTGGAHQEVACFDFRQVAAARSLLKFLSAGVSARRLSRSLRQLERWFPESDGVGDLLPRLFHDGVNVLFRTDNGRLVEGNGQLRFEYESDDAAPSSVAWRGVPDGDALFEEAVGLEQAGRLEDAADRYRQAILEQGPDADVCFNLANVLHGLGETQAAIERLHEALSLDREFVDAWNNLGNLLAEKGRLKEARNAYLQAVAIEPDYADARYGLADVLEQLGQPDQAQAHWRAYLQYEASGPWADYARGRLAAQTA